MFDKSAKYWEGMGGLWNMTTVRKACGPTGYMKAYLQTDWMVMALPSSGRYVLLATTVLANEEIDSIPFVSITPIKIPHKFFGLSVADLVMDLQLMKSTYAKPHGQYV